MSILVIQPEDKPVTIPKIYIFFKLHARLFIVLFVTATYWKGLKFLYIENRLSKL